MHACSIESATWRKKQSFEGCQVPQHHFSPCPYVYDENDRNHQVGEALADWEELALATTEIASCGKSLDDFSALEVGTGTAPLDRGVFDAHRTRTDR